MGSGLVFCKVISVSLPVAMPINTNSHPKKGSKKSPYLNSPGDRDHLVTCLGPIVEAIDKTDGQQAISFIIQATLTMC